MDLPGTVVNVKVAHIRPQFNDLRKWMEHEGNVYIGRGGIVFVNSEDGSKRRWPPLNSKWCNPYKLTKGADASARDNCLILYEQHLDDLLKDPDNLREFKELKGKTLGCWCKPERCHGDVILKKLNELT